MKEADVDGATSLPVRRPVKKKKKKVALPRRQWQINPVTRVKPSARAYSRLRAKSETRDES